MRNAEVFKANLARVQMQTLDRATFEELYATYLPKVYNYVSYRVGDRTVAEDVTAEIFERALTRLHTYRADKGAFSTWLFRIAHNLVANHLRDRQRQPQLTSLDAVPPMVLSGGSPEQAVAEAEQLRRVQLAIRHLPEQQQEVLALKFGSGLGNQEIAQATGLTANHVGVLLHRAVRALRLALAAEEVGE